MAEYLSASKLQELGLNKDAQVERDSTFKSNLDRKWDKEQENLEKIRAAAATEAAAEAAEAAALAENGKPIAPIELDLLSVSLPT